MTTLTRLWHQFWRDLAFNNRLATAEHKQRNKQTVSATPRNKKLKGWQKR